MKKYSADIVHVSYPIVIGNKKMSKRFIIIFIVFTGIIPIVNGQELFPFRKDSLWGFCDSNKILVIPTKYESVSIFSNCGISTIKTNGKYRFLDKSGEFINQAEYDKWTYFWLSRTYAWQENKVGLIDSVGNILVPFLYDDIKFTKGIIGFKKEGKWALFDYYSGKQKSRFKFQDVITRSSKLMGVKIKDKWGFANKKGKIKIKPKYGEITGFSSLGLAGVKQGKYWGFIDLEGNKVGAIEYSSLQNFQTEGAWVKKGEKWGLINLKGEIVIPFQYSSVSYFKEGLTSVKLNGKYGYIDSLGKTVIPFIYDYAFEFSEGFASVCLVDDSCGYIDKEGKTVIPLKFQTNYGSEFSEGLAEVRQNEQYGFIDKNGIIVVEIKYNSPTDYNDFSDGVGMLIDPKTDKRFYFNRNGILFYED